MKKNLLLLPVLLVTTLMSFAAGGPGGNDPKTEKNFRKQFVGAADVSWSKVEEGYTKVSFTWAGHRTEAYFNSQAEFVGAIRGMFFDQLPLSIIRAVDKKFNQPVVLEVREITNVDGTTYSLLLEKKSGRYKVRMNAYGMIEEEEKLK